MMILIIRERNTMENIWTEINNEVPKYMETICRKYDMKCEKVGDLSTMMYNNKCCLVIEIDRFYADFFASIKAKIGCMHINAVII